MLTAWKELAERQQGLRKQAEGEPEKFVEYLRAGLALSANLQHRSTILSLRFGWHVEGALRVGLDRWMERLELDAPLLAEARSALVRHLARRHAC